MKFKVSWNETDSFEVEPDDPEYDGPVSNIEDPDGFFFLFIFNHVQNRKLK